MMLNPIIDGILIALITAGVTALVTTIVTAYVNNRLLKTRVNDFVILMNSKLLDMSSRIKRIETYLNGLLKHVKKDS